MCGIAGVYSWSTVSGGEPAELTRRMAQALTHRGPDGEGTYLSPGGRLALAHRRLAIIDLSESGRQPMADATGRYHITFNGEIYNYRVLRTGLEKKGRRFVTASDT